MLDIFYRECFRNRKINNLFEGKTIKWQNGIEVELILIEETIYQGEKGFMYYWEEV